MAIDGVGMVGKRDADQAVAVQITAWSAPAEGNGAMGSLGSLRSEFLRDADTDACMDMGKKNL